MGENSILAIEELGFTLEQSGASMLTQARVGRRAFTGRWVW
jgi:hypothetical protein